MSAAVLSAIKHAWPDARAKRIANGLGCSVITGKRIASTGKVSDRFRAALIALLDDALAKNLTAIQHHQALLKAQDYAEMVSRAADRRVAADQAAIAEAEGLAGRSNDSQPVARGARS